MSHYIYRAFLFFVSFDQVTETRATSVRLQHDDDKISPSRSVVDRLFRCADLNSRLCMYLRRQSDTEKGKKKKHAIIKRPFVRECRTAWIGRYQQDPGAAGSYRFTHCAHAFV